MRTHCTIRYPRILRTRTHLPLKRANKPGRVQSEEVLYSFLATLAWGSMATPVSDLVRLCGYTTCPRHARLNLIRLVVRSINGFIWLRSKESKIDARSSMMLVMRMVARRKPDPQVCARLFHQYPRLSCIHAAQSHT